MLAITNELELRPIDIHQVYELEKLMQAIYPPVYKHIWHDQGQFYLETTYGSENLEKELSEPGSFYFFVVHKKEVIGILRTVENCALIDLPDHCAYKLHRIYLDPASHGLGIGLKLMNWSIEQANAKGNQIIWLEAMDTSLKAIKFYERLGFRICGSMDLEMDQIRDEFRGMHRLVKYLV